MHERADSRDPITLYLLLRCTTCGTIFRAERISAPRGEYVRTADRAGVRVDRDGHQVLSDEAARDQLVTNLGEALRKSPPVCPACEAPDPCPSCGRGWPTPAAGPAGSDQPHWPGAV